MRRRGWHVNNRAGAREGGGTGYFGGPLGGGHGHVARATFVDGHARSPPFFRAWLAELVNPCAQMVYVGKSADFHTRTQAEIHELMAAFAGAGAAVVRLKVGLGIPLPLSWKPFTLFPFELPELCQTLLVPCCA